MKKELILFSFSFVHCKTKQDKAMPPSPPLTYVTLLNGQRLNLSANVNLIGLSPENGLHTSEQSHEITIVEFFSQYFQMNLEIRWHIWWGILTHR